MSSKSPGMLLQPNPCRLWNPRLSLLWRPGTGCRCRGGGAGPRTDETADQNCWTHCRGPEVVAVEESPSDEEDELLTSWMKHAFQPCSGVCCLTENWLPPDRSGRTNNAAAGNSFHTLGWKLRSGPYRLDEQPGRCEPNCLGRGILVGRASVRLVTI